MTDPTNKPTGEEIIKDDGTTFWNTVVAAEIKDNDSNNRVSVDADGSLHVSLSSGTQINATIGSVGITSPTGAYGGVAVEDVYSRPLSGQVPVTGTSVSGTVYALPNVPCVWALVTRHPDNTATAWIGNNTGTFSSAQGYPLGTATPTTMFSGIGNLNTLKVVFDKAGDKICWLAEQAL